MSRWWLLVLAGCSFDLSDFLEEDKEDRDDDDDDDDDDTTEVGGKGGKGDPEERAGDCALGAEAFCFCSDYYEATCEPGVQQDLEDLCRQGEDDGVISCMARFVDEDYYIDCGQALDTCLDYYEGTTGPPTGPNDSGY
jgi:hypothetical protein